MKHHDIIEMVNDLLDEQGEVTIGNLTFYPSQSKEFMFIQLDNGRLTIMPTNELRFHDKSYTEGDWPKDLKLNDSTWRVE